MTPPASLDVHVLSLPKDAARRERLIADLSPLSLDPNFEMPPSVDQIRRWRRDGTVVSRPEMTDGEVSCALGHLAMIRRAAESDAPFINLEDDARLNKAAPTLTQCVEELCQKYDLVLFGVTTKKQLLGGRCEKVAGHDVFDLDRISIRYLRGALAYSAPRATLRRMIAGQQDRLTRADAWDEFYRRGVIGRIALVDLFAHGDEGESNLEAERRQQNSTARLRRIAKPSMTALLRAFRALTGGKNVI